jgi:hypothetical protein
VNRLIVGLLASLVLAFPLLAHNRDSKYSPREGNCSIRFPGRPKETLQTTPTALGELRVFTATYATSDGSAFLLSWTEFPPETTTAENRTSLYDGVREGLKGNDGEVISDDSMEIGPQKLPGRELHIKKDNGKLRMRFRILVHDGRLYQIAVIGSAKFVDGNNAKDFLDSFEVVKSK